MARLPRFVIPGQPQHTIQRGNNRGIIFVADEDYRFYLQKLSDACKKYDCEWHAYMLGFKMLYHDFLKVQLETYRAIL